MGPIHATYEGGIFRPTEPVVLPEHCPVVLNPRVVDLESSDDMDAIYEIMERTYSSGETDTAARHNEHQP